MMHCSDFAAQLSAVGNVGTPTRSRYINRALRTWLSIAALIVISLLAPSSGYAGQGSVYFLGTVNTLGSSVGNPGQVARDRLGNLWAVSNLNNSIVKWNGTSWTTVISGLSTPYGLAFDSSNNLFVSQTGVAGVYEYPAPNYSSGTKLVPSFNSPVYLAFDNDDNLFVADTGDNAIYELPIGGSYSTKTAVVSSGLSGPGGVALDVNGNLFVADTSNGAVKEYTAASSYSSVTTIATSLNWPEGIAVDPGGNIYVSEVLNGNLDLITARSGYTSLQTIYTNSSTFGSRGVVIDPAGVLYEGDYGGGSVYKISTGSLNLGSSAVGSSSVTTTVTFVFGRNATGVHSNVLTTGEAQHDFTISNASPGSCGGTTATNSFTTGQTCTVNVQYSATAPGLRTGAVELLDGSSNILATGYLYGTGTSPLAAISPGSVSPVLMGTLSPALSAPSNPVWRADGNLFFTDGTTSGRVIEIAPGSGAPSVVSTGIYAIQSPKGVAIDGAGNLFVSDAGDNQVLKIAANGTTSVLIPDTVGMTTMGQIAVDASGTVYATDGANGRIVVAPPNGNVYTMPILGIDMTAPAGIAVDSNYNLYIADSGSSPSQIYKITNGIGSVIDTSSLSPALSGPTSLTIDANGTLYVSDTGNNRIVIIPASGTPSVLAYSYATASSHPQGVAFNLSGQMYIADSGNNAITQYDWTTGGHEFADTNVGSLSSDSPATFTLFNLGNSTLTFAIPGSGNNPSITNSSFSLGSGTNCPELTPSSSEAATLAPLASCTLNFDFQPTAAGLALVEATYTDDSLNVAGNATVVDLFGTGLAVGDTTTATFATLPSSLYSGQSATVSVTVADSTTPSTIPTGSVSFTDSIQGSLGSATIDGSGVASLGSIMFTGAGTHVITASYAGVSGTFMSSSNTASISVTDPPPATLQTPSQSFNIGTVPVGQTSDAATVTFTIATTGLLGSAKVLTLGAFGKGKPFGAISGNTCIPVTQTQVYTAGSTCTMNITFKPKYPGLQIGAVEILDQSNNVLATAYIYGTGTGPEAATLPGTATNVTVTGSYQSTEAMAFDGNGNLYFADFSGNQVFEVPSGGGAAVLIAGTGTAGFAGDGGAATSAELSLPSDVAVDGAGNIYIADFGNTRVRMVSKATGIIITVAGNGTEALTGDNGPATSAGVNGPTGLALDGAGNLYIADSYNHVIRKVTAATGIITTVAGNGTEGFSGDGGLATQAKLDRPSGVVVDGAGNIYIADKINNRVRKVSSDSGIITTVAGNGASSDTGDGALATDAGLNAPRAVAVDAAGNLAILDSNPSIRMVFASTGIIETNSVSVGVPVALREDGAGNLYAADTFFGGLFIVTPNTSFTYPTSTAVGSTDITDGPKTALLVNIGNTALTAVTPGLTPPADFAQFAGSGTPSDCTASFSLTAGATCKLNIEFEPTTSGSLAESFVITDNSLNISSTTQSIGLAGTGLPLQATLTVTGVPNTAQPYGGTFTVGSSGGSGTGAVTFAASGACSVSGTTVSMISGSGTCSVTATKASDGTYAAATSAPATVAASLASQATLTVTGVPNTTQAYGNTFTVGSSGGSGTGAVTFNGSGACAASGTTITVTGGTGTCSVTATKASDGNYAAQTSAAATVAVSTPITLTANVSSLSFEMQTVNTTSGAQTVIVSNPYSFAVPLTSASASGDFAASWNCPSIPAGGNCSIGVTFTPTASGSRTGTLTVANSYSEMSLTVPLTGTGAAAGVAASPANLIFGSQVVGTSSKGLALGIQNTGTSALMLSNVATTGDFATTGNCATIPAGTNCTLTVTFTPSATGSRTGTVTLTDNAGGTTATQTIQLSGSGTQAGATLSTSSEIFPGTLIGASSPALTATLTNSGSSALTGLAVSVLGDFGQTNTCGSTLAAGANCTLSITYTPTIAGAETGTLNISDNLGMQSIVLTGTGLTPGASLNNSQLLFGGQLVGNTSRAQTVVFTNTGSGAVTFSSIALPANFTDTTNCIGAIAAGASCSINITFTPSVAGALSGTLTLTDTAGTQTVSLAGVGISSVLSVSPSFVLFGSQKQGTVSQAQTVVVTNSSADAISLGTVAVTNNFVEKDNCSGATLAAGSNCAISVGFAPSAAGTLSGSLTVASADNSDSTVIALQGQGSGSSISIQPSSISFGSQTIGVASPAQIVTVWNVSSSALSIGTVTASGDFSETDTCSSQTIAAGDNCVLSITMTPTTQGRRTGTIQFVDSVDGLQTVSLSGAGQAPGISLSTDVLAFGSLPITGTSQTGTATGTSQTVVVTNSGSGALDFTSIKAEGDFREANTCGSSVAAGSTCTITVTFVPTALGHRTGILTLNSNAGAQIVSLAGDGSPVGLTLTPPILNFGLQRIGVTSAPLTAILSNNTGQAITQMAVLASGEYAETDDCGSTLANGSSCKLQITVRPTTAGAITGTISVSSGGVTVLGAIRKGPVSAKISSKAENLDLAMPEIAASNNVNSNIGIVATNATTIASSGPVSRLAYGAAPAASVMSGGNAGSSITVIEEDTNGNIVSATDTITITVTGPGGYSKSYTATAAAGTATFDLSSVALNTSGTYTYAAAIAANSGVTSASAVETVSSGGAAAVRPSVGSGQTATIKSAFIAPLTATVVDARGNPVSGVTVTFIPPTSGAGATLSATSAVTDSGGTASITAVANGTAGSYTVIATANGATAGSFLLTNGKASPAVAVASTAASVLSGTSVTFTATVNSSAGSPGGTVSFLDGSTSLGTAALTSGTASLAVTALSAGAHSVTAVYSGDSNFTSLTSSAVSETVLDFKLTATPSTSSSLNPGQSVTYSLTIQPNVGSSLPATTTLTLSGLPSNASASISLSPWTGGAGTSWQLPAGTTYASIPLVVSTSTTTAFVNHPPAGSGSRHWPQLAWCILLAPFALPLRRVKGRLGSTGRWLVLLGAVLAVTTLSGCGVRTGFFGQAQKSYTLTVTATAGTVTHSTTLTLEVQ